MTFLPFGVRAKHSERGSVDKRGPHAHGYPRGLYRNSISPQHSKRATWPNSARWSAQRVGTLNRYRRRGVGGLRLVKKDRATHRFSQRGNHLRNRWPVPVPCVLQHSYDKNGNCFSSSMCRRDYGCAADFHRSQGRCTDHGCVQTLRGNQAAYSTNTHGYLVGPTIQLNLPAHFSIEVDGLYKRLGYQYDQSGPVVATRTVANSWEFPVLGKFAFCRSS